MWHHEAMASANTEETKALIRATFRGANRVQAGLDVAFDIFITISWILFGLNIAKSQNFNKFIGWSGSLIALSLLVLNLYTFPNGPAESGLFDLGPLLGLWALIFYIWMTAILLAIIIVVSLSFLDKIIPPAGIPIAVIAIFILFKWKKVSIKHLGLFNPKHWGKTILIGLIIGIFIQAFGIYVLSQVKEWIGIVQEVPTAYSAIEGNNTKLIIYLVVAWTTAGFGEELIYRSFFLGQFVSVFNNVKSKWILSLIISSIIFGFLHFNNGIDAIIGTTINGFIIGLVYLKTGRNI